VVFGIIYSVIFMAIPIASGMRELSSVWLVAAAFTCIPIALESRAIQPNLLSGVILLSALGLAMSRDAIGVRLRQLRGLLGLSTTTAADAALSEVSLIGHAGGGNGAGTIEVPSPPRGREGLPTLTLEGREITVSFGGVVAAERVSVRVGPGERVGIVGANGAGKTTVFNALTGFVPLHHGRVLLGSEDITDWPPLARARAGIRRTFQVPRLADVLTVGQNVICGHDSDHALRDRRVGWLLDHFGLSALRDVPVSALPFGVRREVELVRALATTPQVLMLDEPVSGLEDAEAEKLVELLLGLQAAEGWGLLVIEHDLKFITSIAEHLIVMEDGRTLLEGPIHEVMRAEEVRRVYLGEAVSL
jgi:branched-chain amino acid transport system ATP-binding protein